MEFQELIKNSFVLVGYSASGKWDDDIVYPIPKLWTKAQTFISKSDKEKIVGVCLPPRSNHYFYTCGMEMDFVDYHKVEKGMTLHTFPKQKYVVFKHIGPSQKIPYTYEEIWRMFDQEGYRIKKGLPEIEIVYTDKFGKEDTNEYEMEIWIPVE
ncbi:AraC family transcriptional regulator [Halobacillus karajensis]|uniref:GyrI-like domain-containing protein n=1 Tax=Halobacillus karajensis TaxID=195088 RepID=UPI0008A76EF3|nr:GyrI-like domain-containing protein [Halobacillus karajensis]SEH46971.1 AraC family transcriptional regulator [Halobacillus karajensis]